MYRRLDAITSASPLAFRASDGMWQRSRLSFALAVLAALALAGASCAPMASMELAPCDLASELEVLLAEGLNSTLTLTSSLLDGWSLEGVEAGTLLAPFDDAWAALLDDSDADWSAEELREPDSTTRKAALTALMQPPAKQGNKTDPPKDCDPVVQSFEVRDTSMVGPYNLSALLGPSASAVRFTAREEVLLCDALTVVLAEQVAVPQAAVAAGELEYAPRGKWNWYRVVQVCARQCSCTGAYGWCPPSCCQRRTRCPSGLYCSHRDGNWCWCWR